MFLYDGKDLYFFLDEVTLIVGNKEITLSPMSYVSCSYLNMVEYYDYSNDKYVTIELGNEKQCELFGEHMRGFQTSGPEEERHIKRWLAGNCFGDNYTRMGLTGAQREMITFCFLAALGTESQLKAHIGGNFHVGNDAHYLINVISNCMPYIGYPRTLNAIRCIHEMEK